MLAELTSLAAEIEAISARTTYRFDASRAYYGMVRSGLSNCVNNASRACKPRHGRSPSPSSSALPGLG